MIPNTLSRRQLAVILELGSGSLTTRWIRKTLSFKSDKGVGEVMSSLRHQGYVRSVPGRGIQSHGANMEWSLTERGRELAVELLKNPDAVGRIKDETVSPPGGRHVFTWLRWLEEISPMARSITNSTDRDRASMAQALAMSAPDGPRGFPHAADCDCDPRAIAGDAIDAGSKCDGTYVDFQGATRDCLPGGEGCARRGCRAAHAPIGGPTG